MGGNLTELAALFSAFLNLGREGGTGGEDKTEDTLNDSSLTTRLMTQHTKVCSSTTF